jgi:hypothetical protein
MWVDGKYYYKETFSLFFRISEIGFIHFAEDVTLEKFNSNEDFKKWREAKYVDKPLRYKFFGAKLEELLPRTANIFATVIKSQELSNADKFSLLKFCITQFFRTLFISKIPLWKRIVLLPFRIVRKVMHVADQVLDRILRA